MLFGKYRFHCRFETRAQLPPFKGSTFRGVFGRALKSVICALPRQECGTCLLQANCLYPYIFETDLPAGDNGTGGDPSSPHPFVIEPPAATQTAYDPEDPFDFALLLFGRVNRDLPYFIYAIERMGGIGIGARVDGSRAKYSLLEVRTGGRAIYRNGEAKIAPDFEVGRLALDGAAPAGGTSRRIRVAFETPLRFKRNGRLCRRLPFHVLARAMLRRASSVLGAYGEGEPRLDYRALVSRAESVQTVADDLRWVDWRRYSMRQKQAMLMGGLTGSIVYQGDLDGFLPLIEFCRAAHVGKQTAFGLGKFNVEVLS